MKKKIALIGLGAIGTPIAHKLFLKYEDQFVLVANEQRRKVMCEKKITVNGKLFEPKIITEASDISILIVCIKNYDLEKSLSDFKRVICNDTVILPLQNGIFSYDFFRKNFPNNIVLHGFVQGPNTKKKGTEYTYINAGKMYIGSVAKEEKEIVESVFRQLFLAGIDVHLEETIEKLVWKKWMLNVVGNSITGLTNADYSDFKEESRLQELCKFAMNEFLKIAQAENIDLTDKDIEDVLDYYLKYSGSKRTSMLEDICNERRTENEYLAGKALELAKKNGIEVPVIQTLYHLVGIKEDLYLKR